MLNEHCFSSYIQLGNTSISIKMDDKMFAIFTYAVLKVIHKKKKKNNKSKENGVPVINSERLLYVSIFYRCLRANSVYLLIISIGL